jgi:hypothetical protein
MRKANGLPYDILRSFSHFVLEEYSITIKSVVFSKQLHGSRAYLIGNTGGLI